MSRRRKQRKNEEWTIPEEAVEALLSGHTTDAREEAVVPDPPLPLPEIPPDPDELPEEPDDPEDWVDEEALGEPVEVADAMAVEDIAVTEVGSDDDCPPDGYREKKTYLPGAYNPYNQPGWQIKPGKIVNRLKIIKPLAASSNFYGRYVFSRGEWVWVPRAYFTGKVLCECMGPEEGPYCGRQIEVDRKWLHPKRPKESKYSCGECCKRPRKKYTLKKKRKYGGAGKKALDLTGRTFTDLIVLERRPGKGWRVQCTLCGGKTIAPRSYQLLRGTITACEGCRPWEWLGKRGPKPKNVR